MMVQANSTQIGMTPKWNTEEFEARLRVLGLKLCIRRLKEYGSSLEFVRAHMRKPPESVKSGAMIIKDVLFIRLLEQLNPVFDKIHDKRRRFFIYSPFLASMRHGYLFRVKRDSEPEDDHKKWEVIFKDIV